MPLPILGLALLSYLAGGIPTGYWVVKWLKGLDIREHGSGNPGTANVYRVAGPLAGAVTLGVDALKGYLPVLLARHAYPDKPGLMLACGACAIIGHDWTVFLGLRGGKGVATSAGVFAAVFPEALAASLPAFLVAAWWTGHISVGSIAGAAALPVLTWLFEAPPPLTYAAAAAALLILYKHIPNIRRLRARKELPWDEKKY